MNRELLNDLFISTLLFLYSILLISVLGRFDPLFEQLMNKLF